MIKSSDIKGNGDTLHTLCLLEKICEHLQSFASEYDLDFSKWNNLHLEYVSPDKLQITIKIGDPIFMGNQPHVHTVEEVKSNIKRIEHNSEGGNGPPTGIAGGSGANYNTGTTEGVPPKNKGDDWA